MKRGSNNFISSLSNTFQNDRQSNAKIKLWICEDSKYEMPNKDSCSLKMYNNFYIYGYNKLFVYMQLNKSTQITRLI
jgi:hypothetical protein